MFLMVRMGENFAVSGQHFLGRKRNEKVQWLRNSEFAGRPLILQFQPLRQRIIVFIGNHLSALNRQADTWGRNGPRHCRKWNAAGFEQQAEMIGKRLGKAAGAGIIDDRAQSVYDIAAVNSLSFDSFGDNMVKGARASNLAFRDMFWLYDILNEAETAN